jgi:hypothetical protein
VFMPRFRTMGSDFGHPDCWQEDYRIEGRGIYIYTYIGMYMYIVYEIILCYILKKHTYIYTHIYITKY